MTTHVEAPPLVSMLVLAYRQPATIEAAIRGALAQTYTPLEIVVSDDASGDGTWQAIQRAVAGYDGPHRLILNRNAANLGIGAHLNRLVALSHGELLFIAAGDDVSLPERCARVVDAWCAGARRLDLIATGAIDLDDAGRTHGPVVPSQLSDYRDAADWLARPPYVIGAAQAWTRRLFERFGPFPAGTVAEDLLMVFRAIVGGGGAATLPEALVLYRRGGISRRRRSLSTGDVVERLLRNSRHAVVEIPQLLMDAARAGQREVVEPVLAPQLKREQLVRDVFAARGFGARWRMLGSAADVPPSFRLRLLVYAGCPAALAPFFAIKRLAARVRRRE